MSSSHPTITKTDLLQLAACKNWFWLAMKESSRIAASNGGVARIGEGISFEEQVRRLFPTGKLIASFGDEAIKRTQQLVEDGETCLFQATVRHNGFLVKADVLVIDEDGSCDIYEVKASNNVKEEYLLDVAIQRTVFVQAGYQVRSCFLVHLASDYVLGDKLDVEQMTVQQDVTAQCRALEPIDVTPLMEEAREILKMDELPITEIANLSCVPKGPNRCGCADVSYADLPEYSVFDIARLTREECSELLRKGHTSIGDVKPNAMKFTRAQAVQFVLTQKRMERVNKPALTEELSKLRFPLYFLDYETCNFAVPRLPNFGCYQHFVFQYSLHVLDSPESELRHYDYLADEVSLLSLERLAKGLTEAIQGVDGSVIGWHRQFEESRNEELGRLLPEYESFFRNLNRCMYDLEDCFKEERYLDYRFKGRTSIKAILPVLCPYLTYSDLQVQNGGDAMDTWYGMIRGDFEKEEYDMHRRGLIEYCKLDTLAMVEIYSKLLGVVAD